MKYLKVLMFILGLILFAVIFIFLGIYLAYNTERDMIIQDYEIPTIIMNVGTGDRSVNQLPTLDTLALTFPQEIGFDRIFDCSSTSNLTVKVTAINPNDPDGNISRLKFYYYNVDDPDRILDYKETWIISPYTYFVVPKMGGEYRFGVILYDNNGGIVNSEDIIGKGPVVYFPIACGDVDVPKVTLKVDSTNVKVGDTVTFSTISKISSDNINLKINFERDRTFYYDFTGDGIWDLVTKKDSVEYVFEEPYENGITPRVAVEYKGKLGIAEGATVYVENLFKPILLYNSIGNTVIFRDLSMGKIEQREICFETDECEAGNKKFKRVHASSIVDNGEESIFSRNDSFIWNYNDYGKHKISISLKNVYGEEEKSIYVLETNNNKDNGRIAPGVNMITIPETILTNQNLEIFLSNNMKNTILMYINNDSGETCYVDTDISTDSNGDGKTDNDADILCNKIAKIVYEPNYDKAIGRVYFTNDGKLTFRNFYVTFEGYILELDEEQLEIYNDITTLVNGIEDISIENTDLKSSLDRLRKNINNRPEVSSLVVQIHEQIDNGGIKMDLRQKELLDAILSHLENEDTIISTGRSEYEENKLEILTMLPSSKGYTIKSTAEKMFEDFEENLYSYPMKQKEKELEKIWNTIIKDGKKNKWMFNENDFTPYFCNIYDYYNIVDANKCSQGNIF